MTKLKFKKKVIVCIACGDTGKNSKGGSCYPCRIAGRNQSGKEVSEKRHIPKVVTEKVSKEVKPKKRVIKFKFKK